LDDEDALAEVTVGVRFLVVPREVLHFLKDITGVCLQGTHWHRRQCAYECAQTGSENSAGKSLDFARETHALWAHSRKTPRIGA
jgi:hypothetical protein